MINIAGSRVDASRAQRVRQISYNTLTSQTAIQLNAVTTTLVFLGTADRQYAAVFTNLDTANDIVLGAQNVTFANAGLFLPANIAVTFDNPLSRIQMQPVQFGNFWVGGTGPGLYGIASAGTPWLGVFIFETIDDGTG